MSRDDIIKSGMTQEQYWNKVSEHKVRQSCTSGATYALPAPFNTRKDVYERDVQKAVLKEFQAMTPAAWRIEAGGVLRGETLCASQMVGLPDIIGIVQGRFVGIEVKACGGRLSGMQARRLNDIQKAGGIALIICTKGVLARALAEYLAGTMMAPTCQGIPVF